MASDGDEFLVCCGIIIIIIICYAVYWSIQQTSNYLYNLSYGEFFIIIIGLLLWIAYEIYRIFYNM